MGQTGRPRTGLPHKQVAPLSMSPEDLAKVRDWAAEIDASVSEVLRALIIVGFGVAVTFGIKALVDAERARRAAVLKAAKAARAASGAVDMGASIGHGAGADTAAPAHAVEGRGGGTAVTHMLAEGETA